MKMKYFSLISIVAAATRSEEAIVPDGCDGTRMGKAPRRRAQGEGRRQFTTVNPLQHFFHPLYRVLVPILTVCNLMSFISFCIGC